MKRRRSFGYCGVDYRSPRARYFDELSNAQFFSPRPAEPANPADLGPVMPQKSLNEQFADMMKEQSLGAYRLRTAPDEGHQVRGALDAEAEAGADAGDQEDLAEHDAPTC